jgi:hypothetical protein
VRKASSQVQSETSAERDEPPRDRHGFRGRPPPPTFSLAALPDDALLSEIDVAAILRMSSATVASWRSQPAHPLRWISLPNGFVRYTVAAIRAYLATPRKPRRKDRSPPATDEAAAPARKPRDRNPKSARRSSRRRADQVEVEAP